jgi:predicted ester cyclase
MADVPTAVQRYVDAINAHDVAAYDDILTPGYTYHGVPSLGDATLDREGQKAFVAELFAGFPDTRIEVHQVLVDGDHVALRQTWSGTHTGAAMGAEPTGNALAVEILLILRLEGDRVAEEWEQLDSLGVMQTLGLVPAAA